MESISKQTLIFPKKIWSKGTKWKRPIFQRNIRWSNFSSVWWFWNTEVFEAKYSKKSPNVKRALERAELESVRVKKRFGKWSVRFGRFIVQNFFWFDEIPFFFKQVLNFLFNRRINYRSNRFFFQLVSSNFRPFILFDGVLNKGRCFN